MTTPAPPDSPQSAGEPADPNPWAPPAAGWGEVPGHEAGAAFDPGTAYWPPYPTAAPQPRNGPGIAALVLGIVGVALAAAVVLFWISWLPALLAVVLGAVGLVHARKGLATNRAMALAGVLLGLLGLTVSTGGGVYVVARVQAVHDRQAADERAARAHAEQRVAKEKARLEAEQAKAAADEKARHLVFGGSYTFADGLKVSVAELEPYTPLTTVYTPPENVRIVQVKVTVTNTGSKQLALSGSRLPTVKDGAGALASQVFDGSRRTTFLPESLAPGQEASSQTQYTLPNAAADRPTVDFIYGGAMQRKSVTWSTTPS
ncbi:hypothetical protein [Kitasatospora sp. NPDC094015]|uniref:hypothetical protein n=1 Tax=Kitasatospora sp. NPDC094015 TaxID=3155205 RepID=UPI003322C36A